MNTKIILQALNESEALKSVNKNAAKIYTNDTDKVKEEIIDNKSKNGGKTTVKTTKKDRKIQFPYGKKPEVPSNNKVAKTSDQNVVKEGASCKELKEGFEHINDVWSYLEDSENEEDLKKRIGDIPSKFGSFTYEIINDGETARITNEYEEHGDYQSDVVDIDFQGDDLNECNSKNLKEEYDNGTWKKHQDAVENEIDAAKEDMDADAFADFCDGIINYCQNCTGDLEQF